MAKMNKIPLWLLLELTYKCPLQCPYCSNPLDYNHAFQTELTTQEWKRVLQQGRTMGALQLGFSGGEPLLRPDLEELVAYASQLKYYTNLITSGLGLTEKRIQKLQQAGLDHIQLSFQGSNKEINDRYAGRTSFHTKINAAQLIKKYEFPTVFNFVLHRENIHQVEEMILLSRELKADYIELANTQYYGWAKLNRTHLLPSREQISQAGAVAEFYQKHFAGVMKILFVAADYYEDRPKTCGRGWGSTFMVVAPGGIVYPCQGAQALPTLTFPNVREHSMEWIWQDSQAFNAYRGDQWMEWMVEPCRSCPEKAEDLGGCRCQAYLLTGDASVADPVCTKSPHHFLIDEAIGESSPLTSSFIPRGPHG